MTALRSSSEAQHDGPTTTSTLSITAPAGIVDGDLVVIGVLLGAVTSTTVSIAEGTWETDSLLLTSGADPLYVFQRIASSEPATYTITLAVAKRAIAAVAGCWDATLLTPDPSVNTGVVMEADFVTTLKANSVASALGILVAGKTETNQRSGQDAFLASGYTLIADAFGYGQPTNGAGDLGREAHIALFEKYDSDDFESVTITANGISTGVRGHWLGTYASGESAALADGGFFKLPRRKFYMHDLPYDLRNIRLGGEL